MILAWAHPLRDIAGVIFIIVCVLCVALIPPNDDL